MSARLVRDYLRESGGGKERQRKYNNDKRKARYPDLIPCFICFLFFEQVGSHVCQIHQMTAREYREQFGFDVKRGMITDELRHRKAQQTLENGTWKNLKK